METRQVNAPVFWLIAGPNGSGKSSLYGSKSAAIYGETNIADAARSFWIINPDLLTYRIRSVERKTLRAANLEAVRSVEAWLEASINAHQSIGVETVLSTIKYRRLVRAAKRRGFEIRLIYVILQNPEINIRRVQMRVRSGGHNVPKEKIRERWNRSLKQLPWFLNECDWALLFDNSKKLRVVGRKRRGTIFLDPTAPEALRRAVEKVRKLRRS
jgi:predicted ABC-type ATPase